MISYPLAGVLRGATPLFKNSSPLLKAGSAKRDAIPLSFQRKTLSLDGRGLR